MSTPAHIEAYLESLIPAFKVVDEVLNEWTGEGCYQFPAMLAAVFARLNWDDKQQRAKEPVIRDYIRNHPDWYVTRGAHGGIMRASEKQKKDAAAKAKADAIAKSKAEAMAALEAQIAKKQAEAAARATGTITDAVDNTNTETE